MHSFKVHNLSTGSTWWLQKNNSKKFVLVSPYNTSKMQLAIDYMEKNNLDPHDIINIGELSNSLNDEYEEEEDDDEYENDDDITYKKQHKYKLERENDNFDYPDLIIGNNIPKIKLDKEFTYVGKINFHPFPKRNNEAIGQ